MRKRVVRLLLILALVALFWPHQGQFRVTWPPSSRTSLSNLDIGDFKQPSSSVASTVTSRNSVASGNAVNTLPSIAPKTSRTQTASVGPGSNSPESPGFARINGHPAHPTRLLVKTVDPLTKPAAGDLEKAGYAVVREFSSGWLLLDIPAPLQHPVSADQADAKGRELQGKIVAFQQSGMFAKVEPDWARFTQLEPNDDAFQDGRLWGLRNTGVGGGLPGADINVVPAWDLTTGSTNVIVAVIDTGISLTHRDLVSQLWRNSGEIEGNGIDDDGNGYIDDVHGINALWPQDSVRAGNPADDNRHGTHCSGTIGASANDGFAMVGVAWQVRIMALKAFNASGFGFDSDALRCIEYAVANGAQILSCSWGGAEFSQPLYDGFAMAQEHGVLAVVAAGNAHADMDKTPFYPAAFDLDNIISVAAIDRDNTLASFSNFGFRSADLAAPGVNILSCDAYDDRGYLLFSGTSMACPHVSGVAALVAAYYPTINLHDWRQRLIATATPVSALLGRIASGGRVNAFAALSSQADGQLELSMAVPEAMPAAVGNSNILALATKRTNILIVAVNDLEPVTNASVRARFGLGNWFDLRNDGVAGDEGANDHLYSGEFVAPLPGVFTLSVEASASGKETRTQTTGFLVVEPPENDRFDQRRIISGTFVEVNGTTIGASREPGEPMHNGIPIGGSVWFEWIAPTNGWLTGELKGSNWSPHFWIYTGIDVQSLIPSPLIVPTWSQGTIPTWSRHERSWYLPVEAGHSYLFAVEGASVTAGSFTLRLVTLTGDPPALAPEFTFLPRDLVQEAGSQAFFPVWAKSPVPVSYSWLFNGAPMPFLTGGTLNNINNANEGLYSIVASNRFGAVTSPPVRLTVVAPAPQTDLFDDFDPDVDTTQWFSLHQGIAATNFGGSVSGSSSLWFAKDGIGSITTRALNATNGGVIRFWLRFGSLAPWSDTWASPWFKNWTGASVGYTESGIGGITFATFYNTNYFQWRQVELPIPPEAQLPKVHFTWNGPGYDGEDGNWALDDVQVILFTNAQPPSITHDLTDVTVIENGDWKLELGVTGVAPWHFAWYHDGVAFQNDRNTYLQRGQTNQNGLYEVVATNPLGSVRSRAARVTIRPEPSLSEALDATNLIFTVGPSSGPLWRSVVDVTHDGEDALFSPFLDEDIVFPRITTTVQGPGILSFWWKASGAQSYGSWQFLLLVDDVEEAHLTGEADWQKVSIEILAGTHVLSWDSPDDELRSDYRADVRLWLDQVSYAPAAPSAPEILSITASREIRQCLMEGIPVSLSVRARGHALSYQWRHDSVDIFTATNAQLKLQSPTMSASGLYTVLVSNDLGVAESSPLDLCISNPAQVGSKLADAFDTTDLVWTTDQEWPWYRQTTMTHDGVDAGSSAGGSNDMVSWVQTQLNGPGLLRYWWKVSSEAGFDQFILYDNDRPLAFIDGGTDWSSETLELESGPHTLRWAYDKDDTLSEGFDRAWLDQVSFTPGPISTPLPLEVALDTSGFSWTTSVPYSWRGETNVNHDGFDAASSSMAPQNSENWIQTSVQGPATLTFWWKISSGLFDELRLIIDNQQVFKISQEADWQFIARSLPAGTHTVRWAFQKSSVFRGANQAWVDEVRVLPFSTRFLSVNRGNGSGLTMEVDGPLGRRLIIEASTDLTHWHRVATNIFNVAGRTTFNLSNLPGPSVFYRGYVSP